MAFSTTDMITHAPIDAGDPVVAIVIKPVDARPHSSAAAFMHAPSASSLFEAVSLPIRGTYDDHGSLKLDESQISVKMLCEMTGVSSFKEFFKKGIAHGQGLPIKAPANVLAAMGQNPDALFGFGLAMVHEETWDKMLTVDADHRANLEAEIGKVHYMVQAAHQLPLKAATRSERLCLNGRKRILDPITTQVMEMPALSCVLDVTMPGQGLLGFSAATWMSQNTKLFMVPDQNKPRRLDQAVLNVGLQGLTDLISLHHAMGLTNRLLMPCAAASQEGSLPVARMAALAAKQVMSSMFGWEEPEDDTVDALEFQVLELERLASLMRCDLQFMKDDLRDDDNPTMTYPCPRGFARTGIYLSFSHKQGDLKVRVDDATKHAEVIGSHIKPYRETPHAHEHGVVTAVRALREVYDTIDVRALSAKEAGFWRGLAEMNLVTSLHDENGQEMELPASLSLPTTVQSSRKAPAP